MNIRRYRRLYSHRCFYCGDSLCKNADTPKNKRTVEHVIPKSRGGKDSKDNKVPCCLVCNGEKGSMTVQEFRNSCPSRIRGKTFFFETVAS